MLLTTGELANEWITNSSRGIQLFSSTPGVLEMSPRYDEAKYRRYRNIIFLLDDKRKVKYIHELVMFAFQSCFDEHVTITN